MMDSEPLPAYLERALLDAARYKTWRDSHNYWRDRPEELDAMLDDMRKANELARKRGDA